MKNLYSPKYKLFLFSLFLLYNAQSSSKEIINKYSSIKTKHNIIILNITKFNYYENIYLTLKTDIICEDYLEYKFYDDINEIFKKKSDELFKLRPYLKEKYNIFEIKTYFSYYYTIMKRKESLYKSDGNYLLLVFECESGIEVINTKDKHKNISIFKLLFYSFISIIVIFILIKIIKEIIIITKDFDEIRRMRCTDDIINNNNINFFQNQKNINYTKERMNCIININENNTNNSSNYIYNLRNNCE